MSAIHGDLCYFFHVWITVIASAVIVLVRLTVTLTEERKKEERKSEDRHAGLVLQRCFPAKLTLPLLMEALGNA